jgi:hypothetical protein
MFRTALFVIAQSSNNPKVHQGYYINIWKYYNEPHATLYNEYVLIKMWEKRTVKKKPRLSA